MQYDIPLINNHFKDINPVVAGWEQCEKKHYFGPAIRHYFLIHYILSGKGIFRVKDKTYALSKGDMFLIRPDILTYYEADVEKPWEYVWIGFDGEYAKKFIENTHAFTEDAIHFPEGAGIFKSIFQLKGVSCGCEIMLCGKVFELFSMLMIKDKPNADYRSPVMYVKKAQNYIDSNYMDDIKVEGISRMLGIDRRYLCRIFKSSLGKTVQEYIVDLRLEKAAQFLINFDYTPGEAASSTGYRDIYNFSKMFKKKYGLSPLNYKKEICKAV